MQENLTGLGDALNYCEHCESMSSGKMTVTDNGPVCETCADEFFACGKCAGVQNESNYFGSTRTGKRICDTCASYHYAYCQSCSVLVLDEFYNFTMDACNRCASEYGSECDACGDWSYHEDGISNNRGFFCGYCAPEYDHLDGVRGYHERAPWGLVFHHADTYHREMQDGSVYFGVEVEMVGDGHVSDILATVESNRDGHAESDSSLGGGLELITQPATLDAWRGEFGARVAQYVAQLNAEGLSAESELAGQHIHVSRCAFMDAKHLARFAAFFPHNRAHVIAVSGRGDECGDYAHLEPFGSGDLGSLAKFGRARSSLWRGWSDRTRAVNLTNPETVEIRIWAGTDNVRETLGALEYVAALIEFTKGLTVGEVLMGALLVDSFAAWLADSEQATRYAHAVALIVTRDGGRMAA